MTTILTGTVRGRTIQLSGEPGFPEGQTVTVVLQSAEEQPSTAALEALRRAAGTWSDDIGGLDRYLEWNRQQRKFTRPEVIE